MVQKVVQKSRTINLVIKASNAVYLNQINSEQICYQDNSASNKFATSTPIFIANNYYPIRIVLLSIGSALLSFYYLRDGTD